MKIIILSFLLFALIQAGPKYHQLEGYTFEQYVKDFEKPYIPESEEYIYRQKIFEEKLIDIELHNSNPDNSWKKGVNKFSDQTKEEFSSKNKGLKKKRGFHQESKRFLSEKPSFERDPNFQAPEEWDWRKFPGVVSAVKDQGNCGSCWAFSSTETIESHVAINSNKTYVLAPQVYVDCSPNPHHCGGTGGCDGSIEELAFLYTQLFGQVEESNYPYTAKTGTCHFDPSQSVVTNDGFLVLEPNNQDELLEHLMKGPVAIGVDASWSDYESGVFSGCDYNKNIDVDHAVNLVGYGKTLLGKKYWIVRNSWGADWGMDGYIHLLKEDTPQCGKDTTPTDNNTCDGDGITEQTVCGMCGMLSCSTVPLNARAK